MSQIAEIELRKSSPSKRLYPASDVAQGVIIAPPPLFKDFLLDSSFTLLTAERGTGKTWLQLELMRCLESRSPLFGKFDVLRSHSRVLFVGMDSSPWDVGKQWMKLLRGNGMVPAPSSLASDFMLRSGKRFSITDPVTQQWLHDWIDATGTTCVMFDALRSIHLGNENDSLQMELLTEAFRALRDRKRVSVIVSHHHRKSQQGAKDWGNDASRGSGAIVDAADFHIQLRKKAKDLIVLSMEKGREDFEGWTDLTYKREQLVTPTGPGVRLVLVTASAHYQPILDAIMAGAPSRTAIVAIIKAKQGGDPSKFVENGLTKLKEEGLIVNSARGEWRLA